MDATGGRITLPSSCYFKVHNACVKIAHFSGAGKVMEEISQQAKDLKVFAEEGGSHLLSFAISLRLQGLTLAYSRSRLSLRKPGTTSSNITSRSWHLGLRQITGISKTLPKAAFCSDRQYIGIRDLREGDAQLSVNRRN